MKIALNIKIEAPSIVKNIPYIITRNKYCKTVLVFRKIAANFNLITFLNTFTEAAFKRRFNEKGAKISD